jgi:hypothetical protein
MTGILAAVLGRASEVEHQVAGDPADRELSKQQPNFKTKD